MEQFDLLTKLLYFLLVLVELYIYYLIFSNILKIFKDRRKKYSIHDLKFFVIHYDSNDYLGVSYSRLERKKARYLRSLQAGTQIGEYVILNYACNIKKWNILFTNGRRALYRYKINLEIDKEEVLVHVDEWSKEILEQIEINNENKLMIIKAIHHLSNDEQIDKNLAKGCINILSKPNTKLSFDKVLIKMLSKLI